ncbi:MAG TPA: hypothetical protein VEK57_16015 [Thermoanaerobaculia bacterium]|nr:hypothetical protein [Thermoanaerobaculia bacterium]
MRRLVLILGLLALPLLASAQKRESVLTPHGVLFTVESVDVSSEAGGFLSSNLVLREQFGTESHTEIIPATLEHGAHTNPAIAYDADSKTLFVFWLRHVGITSGQLLFACRDANGTWTPARTFGDQWNRRTNLRIALTRRVAEEDGTLAPGSAVSVHLVWWESSSEDGAQAAQYAMVTIDNGAINGEPDYLGLKQFTIEETPETDPAVTSAGGTGEETTEPPVVEAVDPAVLRQPLLFASPKQDSVLVIFGDVDTGRLHQVRIRPAKPPVANGRLRVPVGRGEGSSGAPTLKMATDASRVEGIYSSTERLALFTRDNGKLQYVIMKDAVWSETREIPLDEQITSTAAVDALRRLLNEH